MKHHPRQENLPAVKNRRYWSLAEKRSILQEADLPGASVSAVARNHGIAPSILFSWKRQLNVEQSTPLDAAGDANAMAEYAAMLTTIRKREALLELAADRISTEAASGNTTGYNLACAVSNLVNATGKLQERKLDLIERLVALQESGYLERQSDGYNPADIEFAVEKEAERLCYVMVKAEVERNRLLLPN